MSSASFDFHQSDPRIHTKGLRCRLLAKFYNGLFSEPTSIEAYGRSKNDFVVLKFAEVKNLSIIRRNLGVFIFEDPYAKLFNYRIYLSPNEFRENAISDRGKIIFDKVFDNILYYEFYIQEEWDYKRSWINYPIQIEGKKETDITDKQWKFILDIEDKFDKCFDGETKQDASEFISIYADKIKKRTTHLGDISSNGYGGLNDDEFMWEAPINYY